MGVTAVERIDVSCMIQASQEGPVFPTPPQLTHHGDDVRAFDEIQAARGILGRFPGEQLIPLIQQLLQQP